MSRFVLALTTILLTASFSGALELFVPEPCAATETSSAPDGACPPTCARCGCCPQPVVPGLAAAVVAGMVLRNQPPTLQTHLVSPDPNDILHVPRFFLT